MKPFRILKSNFIESFKGVFRNFSLSIASIICITITLILVGLSMFITLNVNNFTAEIEKDMTIVVFLERKVTDEEIDKIKEKIENLDNVKSIAFNSKEDVKASMEKESDVFKTILSEYDESNNPLQDSFLVKVVDINNIGNTASEIEQIEKVSLVKYGEGSVEELVKIFDLVKKITYIAVIALVVVTAFLISNTIKITIQSRKREIEIRRLVGASNAFIRQPFFFEGIIIGFLGSIIPVCLCCFGYDYMYKRLGGKVFTDIIKLIKPSSIIYIVMVSLVVIGIVVGAFGSFRAVRKYLKV
jgi:cell division transport system permease protein